MRKNRSARLLAGVAVALTLAAAGCAASGVPEPPSGTPEVHPAWQSCQVANPPKPVYDLGTDVLGLPRLGKDFTPVSAVLCGTSPRPAPAGGENLVATEQRSDSVDALVAALRLPDEPRSNGACTANLITVGWFALLDAEGRWLRPGVPVDGCGKPRREVRDALDRLVLRTVTSRKVGEITSSAAAAADCSQSWADMIAARSRMGTTPAPLGATVPAAGDRVRLCVYRVPESEQGSGKPGGQFVDGAVLPARRWAAIRRALPTGSPAAPCAVPASRFATLSTGGGDELYVELDGCRRVLNSGGGGLAAAPPALLTAIEQALS
jgi:hypothetical protein